MFEDSAHIFQRPSQPTQDGPQKWKNGKKLIVLLVFTYGGLIPLIVVNGFLQSHNFNVLEDKQANNVVVDDIWYRVDMHAPDIDIL